MPWFHRSERSASGSLGSAIHGVTAGALGIAFGLPPTFGVLSPDSPRSSGEPPSSFKRFRSRCISGLTLFLPFLFSGGCSQRSWLRLLVLRRSWLRSLVLRRSWLRPLFLRRSWLRFLVLRRSWLRPLVLRRSRLRFLVLWISSLFSLALMAALMAAFPPQPCCRTKLVRQSLTENSQGKIGQCVVWNTRSDTCHMAILEVVGTPAIWPF